MKLNTQQKVIIGIFALALLGLLCDRAFLLPRQASASGAGEGGGPDARLIFTLDTLPDDPQEELGIKHRLEAQLPGDTLDINQLRDAFMPSSDWLAHRRSALAKSTGPAEDFAKAYRLQAIMFQDEVKAIVLNDTVLRVGDTVDGYELVALSETSAVFSRNGVQIELLLE